MQHYMTVKQLESLLKRRVIWAGSATSHQEYIVGKYKQMRIRVRNGHFSDVHDNALTVEEIQAETI